MAVQPWVLPGKMQPSLESPMPFLGEPWLSLLPEKKPDLPRVKVGNKTYRQVSLDTSYLKNGEFTGLTPGERMMVAIYERALKDWMMLITSDHPMRGEIAYLGACWLLGDADRAYWESQGFKDGEDFISFQFACDTLGWKTDHIRERTIEIFKTAKILRLRSRLLAAVNAKRKMKRRKFKKVHQTFTWLMSNAEGPDSFLEACKEFELDPEKTRTEVKNIFYGGKPTGYLSGIKKRKFPVLI